MKNETILGLILIPIIFGITIFLLNASDILTPNFIMFSFGLLGIFISWVTIPILFNQGTKRIEEKDQSWKWQFGSILPLIIIGNLFLFSLIFFAIPIILINIILVTILLTTTLKKIKQFNRESKTAKENRLKPTSVINILFVALILFIVLLIFILVNLKGN